MEERWSYVCNGTLEGQEKFAQRFLDEAAVREQPAGTYLCRQGDPAACLYLLLDGVVENHLISSDVADLPEQFQPYADYLRGRFMLVKKADMFPAECIVRGYITGSGWASYQKNGTVCGITLPDRQAQRYTEPTARIERLFRLRRGAGLCPQSA